MVVAGPVVAPSSGCEYFPWTYGGAVDGDDDDAGGGGVVAAAGAAGAAAAAAAATAAAAAAVEALRAWTFAAGRRPTGENSAAALARTAAACL